MKYIKQLSIIATVCLAAEVMEYFIPLPIAASVYGLVLMLFLLITKIVPLNKVEDLSIMFIPPTVGIMASVEEMKAMLVPLFVISMVTTLLIMGVTGRVSQFMIRFWKEDVK